MISHAAAVLAASRPSGCSGGNVTSCLPGVGGFVSGLLGPGVSVGAGQAAGSAVNDVASSAWDSICQSFGDAFGSVLQWFGGVFASMPDPDLTSIRGVYAISLTLGMITALVLLTVQAGSVLWTRSGAPLAQALTGLAKAVVASMLTLAVASQVMKASDALAAWIVAQSGTGMDRFSTRLVKLASLGQLGQTGVPAVLMLLFGLLGLVVVVVLWFELVLRNAAFTVLVATAPIAAAGQVGASTQDWWRKLLKAAFQLAAVKPVVALVFTLGFAMTGGATGITGLISGMAVLFMAVFAWPVVARFFTFTSAAVGGATGVGALVGAVANRSAGGGPGIDPAAFGRFSESRAMAANAGRAGAGASATGGAAGGATGAGATAGAGVAAAAGPAAVAVAALQSLHKTVNALASRMEQQAGHAGLEGANPTAYPAGYPAYGPVRMPRRSPGPGGPGPASGGTPTSGPSTTPASAPRGKE